MVKLNCQLSGQGRRAISSATNTTGIFLARKNFMEPVKPEWDTAASPHRVPERANGNKHCYKCDGITLRRFPDLWTGPPRRVDCNSKLKF